MPVCGHNGFAIQSFAAGFAVQTTSNPRGAAFMLVAMASFAGNDTLTKSVFADLSMAQAMLVRGIFATLMIAALAWSRGALKRPGSAFHPAVAIRVLCEIAATTCFFIALSHMPLANVSAVLQALPLAVTMGAALFLSEPVGWRRWLAIGIGFAGVLIVMRPGFSGFNAYSLLALLCVLLCAVRDLATRQIPGEIPTLLVSTATSAGLALAGAALLAPYGGWTPMSGATILKLLAAAVLLLVAYQSIITSLRVGEISFIAPFRYSALLWSILLGYLAFGDVPDAVMIAGACLVVSSGLYALYRERRVGHLQPVAESTGPAMAPDGI